MRYRSVLCLLFVLSLHRGLALAEALQLTAEQVANLELTTVTVESREVIPTLNLTGILVPDRRKVFRLAPVVDGMIITLEAVEHDQVRQGQVLAQLRSSTLGQAQAEYLEALAHFQLVQAERERLQALWQDGVVPESRWLKADSDYMTARASLDQARRLLSLAGLSEDRIRGLEQAGDQLADFSLVSPVDGVVMDTWIETGQMLAAGEPAFRVADLSSLWVKVLVPTASLSQVAPGAEARVHVRAYPGRAFSGRLQSLGAEVDEDSQTLEGRIVLGNEAGLLRPGMYAQVDLEGLPQQGLMVPASAVFRVGDQSYVFKVGGSQRFEPLAVEVGPTVSAWIQLAGDALAPGTEIVTGGLAELKSHWLYQGGE